MEKMLGLRKAGATLAVPLTVLMGCSTISKNDTIDDCDMPTVALKPATIDEHAPGYDPSTDPYRLAALQYDQAKKTQDEDTKLDWDMSMRNQVVGIGELACKGANGGLYLTADGARLSLEYSQPQ